MKDVDETEILPVEAYESREVMEQLEKIAYEREKIKLDLIKEFTPPSLKAKSEVTVSERYYFSRLEILAEPFVRIQYRNHFLDKFIDTYLEYGISLFRKGRVETKDVIQSFYASTLGVEQMMEQMKTQEEEHTESLRERLRRYLLE